MKKIRVTNANKQLEAKVFPVVTPWTTEIQPGNIVALTLGGAEIGQAEIIRGIKVQNLSYVPEVFLMLISGDTDAETIRSLLRDYYGSRINDNTPFGIYLLKRTV